MSLHEEIEALVQRIYSASSQFNTLKRYGPAVPPAGPATLQAIDELEVRFGRALPADYRTFLELHDGWPEYSGDSAMLSVAQMLGGPIQDKVARLKALMVESGDKRSAQGFVIQASPQNSSQLLYFDLAKKRADGGLDVVFWEHEPEERYKSFLGWLKDEAESHESLLAEEAAKRRKPRKI